jgi:hypothetical protein
MAAPKGHAKYGGRLAGTPNKATAEIRDLARADGPAVFKELVRLAFKSNSEQTRVAAIKEILDRAYGRPTQPIDGDEHGGPVIVNVVTGVRG